MTTTESRKSVAATKEQGSGYPFHITREEERDLRLRGAKAVPAPVIGQASSFDEYVQQLMIPPVAMDLARKAENLRLSPWQVEAMRKHLAPHPDADGNLGLLRRILQEKAREDETHPPYIRVACTGRSTFDHLALEHGHLADLPDPESDIGSPVVLEIWPAQHYSPIHSHGDTTGIVFCLAGQLDVMLYDSLDWNAGKIGLITLTPGQCAWLSKGTYAVHRVACPLNGGEGAPGPGFMNDTDEFGASFHVYLNEDETAMLPSNDGQRHSRDAFDYIDEITKEKKTFLTHSDLSWSVLRRVLADTEIT